MISKSKTKHVNRMSVFSLDDTDFSLVKEMADRAFINDYLAINFDVGSVRADFVNSGLLYHFHEGRILLITAGYAEVELNMECCRMEKGDIMLIQPDVIVEFKSSSDDFNFTGLMFREDIPVERSVYLKATASDWEQTERMVRLLWDIVHNVPFRRNTVRQLLMTIVAAIVEADAESTETLPSAGLSRQEQLFKRFKMLVSQHCTTERNISFYAGRLCISPHYLSAIVSNVSGETVMHWINRAVILQAKVMLMAGDMMVYEVADRLNFPNQSFFGRFFKRETGMTPGEWQRLKVKV